MFVLKCFHKYKHQRRFMKMMSKLSAIKEDFFLMVRTFFVWTTFKKSVYDGFNWNFWVVQGSGGRFAVSIRNSSVVLNQILCVMFVVLPWMLMKFIFDPIRHRFFCKYKS